LKTTVAAGPKPVAFRLTMALAALVLTLIAGVPAASAKKRTHHGTGGAVAVDAASGGAFFSEPAPTAAPLAPVGRAVLSADGRTAIAPADAPPAVKAAIAAANRIVGKPYRYGGGHARWEDSGYDCSGTVSYALRGAKLLRGALPSGSLTSWGKRGRGDWITVYAHGGHTYAVIAGLRLDTSGPGERGPRWRPQPRSSAGFVARHPFGL
jgi:hypothetical protein